MFGEPDGLLLRACAPLSEAFTARSWERRYQGTRRVGVAPHDLANGAVDTFLSATESDPFLAVVELRVGHHIVGLAPRRIVRSVRLAVEGALADMPHRLVLAGLGGGDLLAMVASRRLDALIQAVERVRGLTLAGLRPTAPDSASDGEAERALALVKQARPRGHLFLSTPTLVGYRTGLEIPDDDESSGWPEKDDRARLVVLAQIYPGHDREACATVLSPAPEHRLMLGDHNVIVGPLAVRAALRFIERGLRLDDTRTGDGQRVPIIGTHTLVIDLAPVANAEPDTSEAERWPAHASLTCAPSEDDVARARQASSDWLGAEMSEDVRRVLGELRLATSDLFADRFYLDLVDVGRALVEFLMASRSERAEGNLDALRHARDEVADVLQGLATCLHTRVHGDVEVTVGHGPFLPEGSMTKVLLLLGHAAARTGQVVNAWLAKVHAGGNSVEIRPRPRALLVLAGNSRGMRTRPLLGGRVLELRVPQALLVAPRAAVIQLLHDIGHSYSMLADDPRAGRKYAHVFCDALERHVTDRIFTCEKYSWPRDACAELAKAAVAAVRSRVGGPIATYRAFASDFVAAASLPSWSENLRGPDGYDPVERDWLHTAMTTGARRIQFELEDLLADYQCALLVGSAVFREFATTEVSGDPSPSTTMHRVRMAFLATALGAAAPDLGEGMSEYISFRDVYSGLHKQISQLILHGDWPGRLGPIAALAEPSGNQRAESHVSRQTRAPPSFRTRAAKEGLARFLADAFSPDEIEDIARGIGVHPNIYWRQAAARVVRELVAELAATGALDQEFRDRLIAARPLRADEIHRIALA